MKIGFTSVFLQLLITLSLFSLAFFTFTQTSVFGLLTDAIRLYCSSVSFLRSLRNILPSLLVLFAYVLVLLIGVFGGKDRLNFVYYLSIALYFPSAFAFSAVNWIEFAGSSVRLESFLSFNQVLLVGIALISCRLFLVNLLNVNLRKNEFFKRGEDEAEGIAQKLILYCSSVLGLAVVIAVIAMLALVVGEAAITGLFLGLPYPFLLFGLGSSFTLIIFLYYYLKKGSE